MRCSEAGGVLVVKDDPEAVEADLSAGLVACPGCGGRLARWGFGSERVLRTLDGVRRLRPRRTRCSSCGTSHVLEPASTVVRHRDTAEVIGTAWLAKVAGAGHRAIAARLDRPVSTVRRWLRRLGARAEALRTAATWWAHEFDTAMGPLDPAGSALADALEAVGVAVAAAARRLGPRPPWEAAIALTGGLIASPGPRHRDGVKGGRQAVP
ncbi:MAG: helix-turn-helix domain-containing protein [Acidimicrobiales bacterium]